MKKIFLIPILVSIALISIVSAQTSTQVNYTITSANQGIVVTQLTYSPYPADPGEYFDLWIQAEYLGTGSAPNATFILEPSYPFSLDPGANTLYSFSNLGPTQVLLHYKVRVDQNAVQGDNELDLYYSPNGGLNNVWSIQPFHIQVANAQTDFDLVIQETTSTGTSIGIANTGENTANSLIVRIPSQSDFTVQGTNGQIVGNLNSGDYTIVTFDIVPSFQRVENQTFVRPNNNQTLQVELDYTDSIGVRRSVIEEIPFSFASLNSTLGNFASGAVVYGNLSARGRSQSSIFTNTWFWIVISAVAVIIGIVILGKFRKKKRERKDLDHSKKILDNLKIKNQEKKDSKEPDWVVSERTKKK
jgi:hypothetical protein